MTQQEVKDLMESSNSQEEWNANIDKVKAAHNGDYPSYWYVEIVTSGLAQRTANKFGKTTKIELISMEEYLKKQHK